MTGYSPVIIAEATTSLKRLSVSEAVMELDLTGAACLVFQHGSSGRVNVIYRRADGNVGWIDPPAAKAGGLRRSRAEGEPAVRFAEKIMAKQEPRRLRPCRGTIAGQGQNRR